MWPAMQTYMELRGIPHEPNRRSPCWTTEKKNTLWLHLKCWTLFFTHWSLCHIIGYWPSCVGSVFFTFAFSNLISLPSCYPVMRERLTQTNKTMVRSSKRSKSLEQKLLKLLTLAWYLTAKVQGKPIPMFLSLNSYFNKSFIVLNVLVFFTSKSSLVFAFFLIMGICMTLFCM